MATLKIYSKAQSGFTILEMLIVLGLIGVISGAVVLSLTGSGAMRLREEAENLQAAIQLAADEAVFQNTEIGLQLSQTSYGFVGYDPANNLWHPLKDSTFLPHAFPEEIHPTARLEGRSFSSLAHDAKAPPALIILSTGEMTPFAITLSSVNAKNSFIVEGDGVSAVMAKEVAHE